jgi:peptidoglycan/xylan/chitin deacetylase (PgdA/CDA1 family)
MRKFLSFCLVCLLSIYFSAQQRSVALTLDDLPLALAGRSENATPAEVLAETRAVNKAILRALRAHHAPAIAFVNEKQVIRDRHSKQNRAILREWIRQVETWGRFG